MGVGDGTDFVTSTQSIAAADLLVHEMRGKSVVTKLVAPLCATRRPEYTFGLVYKFGRVTLLPITFVALDFLTLLAYVSFDSSVVLEIIIFCSWGAKPVLAVWKSTRDSTSGRKSTRDSTRGRTNEANITSSLMVLRGRFRYVRSSSTLPHE